MATKKKSGTKKKNRTKYPRADRDLVEYFDEINEAYFGGMVCAGIEFSYLTVRGNDTIYGTCTEHTRIIKINALLDDPDVPEWVTKFVVFHEMLHLFHGYANRGDLEHPPRFRTIEKRHPDYIRFEHWDANQSFEVIKKWENIKNGVKK